MPEGPITISDVYRLWGLLRTLIHEHDVCGAQVLHDGQPNHLLTLGEVVDLIGKELSHAAKDAQLTPPF
jgi:hypothetical protein